MKKVSVKMFFTVLWRGVCQAFGWFFGLFGYKRDGKFAKCVWGLFATSSAITMAIVAGLLAFAAYMGLSDYFRNKGHSCEDPTCYENRCLYNDIYYHAAGGTDGYVYNVDTGKKLLKNVEWIAVPEKPDSLVCFSDGKRRGYFNRKNGQVVIEPKYRHAWVFSEGIACVDEDGQIKFIDGTGKVIAETDLHYYPGMDGFVFHGGYCVIYSEDEQLYGMMDKTGKMVLPLEYEAIYSTDDREHWCIKKDKEMAVLDKDLNPVLPMMECEVYVGTGTIDATMPDHTMRKYDLQGTLIDDFYVSDVYQLEYETDEIKYRNVHEETIYDDEVVCDEEELESYHPKATARLRAYVAGDGYEGLMTPDGHVVTMPLYVSINAIGPDLYLCTSTNTDKLVVNGRGEVVR